MKAKWLISTTDTGVNLTYHNLVDDIVFDCGTTKASSRLEDFINFALAEGADSGDVVFLDGVKVCEIILNEEINARKENCSN